VRRAALVALLAASCIHVAPHPIAPADTAAMLEQRTLDATQTWDLQHLTEAALKSHPDLDVARAHAAVMHAEMLTAAERPNPTVSANVEHKAEPHTNPWITTFGFDLPIETANKRGLRVREASEAARAADFAIADQAWQVRSGVRAQLVAYAAARRSIDILTRQRALNDEIVDMLEKRVGAGEASAPEATQARIAARQTALLIRDRTTQAAEARARLAAAIGVPERAVHDVKLVFDIATFPASLGGADALVRPRGEAALTRGRADEGVRPSEFRVEALTQRPDILAALAGYAESETALRLELAKRYPDLHIAPGFGWDQGFARWALGFNAVAPILSRNRGPIAEAEARRKESETKLIALQAKIIAALDEATVRVDEATAKVNETSEVVALDRQRVDQTQKLFDAGEADRLALRTAQLELESALVAQNDAYADAQAAIGALEDAMQQEIP